MNELHAKLLRPVSPEQPCGPDLSYDPRFDQLEALVLGKPEVEIGSVKTVAEPPDWRELTAKSSEFLAQCKHLRPAVMFCCGLLKTEGFAGFSEGLQLIRSLLEQYWPTIYPVLDPEDNNDPTQRLNILSTLSPKRESMGLGWLTFIQYLQTTTICQPKGFAPVTFEQLYAAKLKNSAPKDASPPGAPDRMDLAKLEATLRAGSNQVASRLESLVAALEGINGIDQFLTTTLGPGNTISFEVLQSELQQMVTALKPFLPTADGSNTALAHTGEGTEPAMPVGGGVPLTIKGSIRSREDVERALTLICEYYRQVEPSSPVPYLLKRAQKLASMNFVEAVQELNLGTVDSLKPSLGSGLDGLTSAPPAAT